MDWIKSWTYLLNKKSGYWLPGPIIFLAIFCALWPRQTLAREVFDIGGGTDIKILGDRTFQKLNENIVEAVGNVVILYRGDTLYGEMATLNTLTGQLQMTGNVRFVGADVTLFGTDISFNTHSGHLEITNARLLNSRYTLMGTKLIRPAPGLLIAEEAEYSTCKDCPESWSIFAKRAYITKARYLTAHHAVIKINGVSTSYLPFLVIPLKRGRETGLLFPQMSLRPGELTYRQPWFWAISDHADLTLTPGVKQTRGGQLEGELRGIYGGRSWANLDWFSNADRVYVPGKQSYELSGGHYNRLFGVAENHFQIGRNFTSHLYFSETRDLDILRDYSDYTMPRMIGSELGGWAYLGQRFNWLEISAEGTRYRNTMVPHPLGKDPTYVQSMPSLHLGTTPVQLWSHSFFLFPYATTWANASGTAFSQEHERNRDTDGGLIRNARRINLRPELALGIVNTGPFDLKSTTTAEYQSYEFPLEQQRQFLKRSIFQKTEASFEIDRVMGLAYKEEHERDELFVDGEAKEKDSPVNLKKRPDLESKANSKLIGDLPAFSDAFAGEKMLLERSSFRHSQRYRMIHHFTGKSSLQGNPDWRNQIENISGGEGLFDENDKMRNIVYNADDVQTVTALSERNTLEFRWENSLIQKKSLRVDAVDPREYLTQNYSFSKVAYFDISQGVELNTQRPEFEDNLTRLMTSTGYNYGSWGFGVTDYYFYLPNRHIVNTSISRSFPMGSLGFSYDYSNQEKTKQRLGKLSGSLKVFDFLGIEGNKSYDFLAMDHREWLAKLVYTPLGDCWRSDLTIEKGLLETTISINFLFNFDGKGFVGLQEGAGS